MKIGDLFIKLGLQKGEFDKGIDDAKRKTSAFGSAMGKIGGMIAGVFAVGQIVQFGKEVFNIATQAEGVQTAFYKIGSARDLDRLRDSVRGTVSDLDLMKRAVQAQNFGIPVQELGRLFEFASKRAQDTGQSVDYLVDSIVMGIGRKSPLILDNLGISAVQLKSKLHGVGLETASVADITRAVGDIAEESFKKSGRFAETLGSKVQTLSASFENLKLTFSSLFSNSQWIKDDLDDWSKLIQIWQDSTITKWQKFLASVSQTQADKIYAAKKLMDDYAKMYADARSAANISQTNSPKQDPIVLTAVEQLAALKKVNDELEAQRILRQEFKGEKMTPMTPLYMGKGDLTLPQQSDTGGVFGNLDSHYEKIKEKRKKFTEEELQSWTEFSTNLNEVIAQGIGEAISTLASGLGELAAGKISGGEFGAQILSVVGKFMQTLGGLFLAYGIANLKFMKALLAGPTPMGAGLAIAAGIGLIAAGAAISSFASKGVSGGGASSIAASGYSNYSQSSGAAVLSGNVVFELEGTKLRGALNNTDRRNTLIR